MIKIEKSPNPPNVLTQDGASLTTQNCEAFEVNPQDYTSAPGVSNRDLTKMKFDNGVYGEKTVKARLIADQHEKCCFCEAKFTANGYGDVEHFRPKGAYKKRVKQN